MLKSKLPELVRKISIRLGRLFARLPLTPNQWTLFSSVPALLGLYYLLLGRMGYGLSLFIVAAVVDAIDGGVARVRGATTKYGAYLDGMMDRFVEAALLFGLMPLYPSFLVPGWVWPALMLFFGTTMTTFARAYADHRKVVTNQEELEAMGGTLERAERLLLIFLSMTVWFINPLYATYTLAIGVVLALLTVLQRMYAVSSARSS